MEFTEGSMSTRSFSFRDIVSGFSSTSLDPLRGRSERAESKPCTYVHSPDLDLWLVVPFDDLGKKERDHVLPTRGPR